MPIYEYRCSACGHKLEALQKLSEARLVACPSCKAAALVKQVSAAGFHLKGSGWYATDFKGSQKPATDKAAADKPADGAKPAGETKTETKSETKSDTKSDATASAATPAAPATKG